MEYVFMKFPGFKDKTVIIHGKNTAQIAGGIYNTYRK